MGTKHTLLWILFLAVCVGLGCGHRHPPQTPLLHSSEIARLELLASDLDNAGVNRELARLAHPPGGEATPPRLPPTDVLPRGYEARTWTRGRDAWAVGVINRERVRVLLFDVRWKPIGEVAGLPAAISAKDIHRQGFELAWDPTGRRLGVMLAEQWDTKSGPPQNTPAIIGTVDLPSLALHILARPALGETPFFGWAPAGLLVVHYDYASGHNRVLSIDPATGRTDVVYDGAGDDSDSMPIQNAGLSADGSLLVFSRMFVSSSPRCGIWLLSLSTRKATEITTEAGGWYYHTFYAWMGRRDNSFLFSRFRRSDGKTDLYRAYLADGPTAK